MFLFNEKHSIKTQLGVSFLAITIVSIGVCLAISLGFTAALAKSSYSTTKSGISDQTKNNAAIDAAEFAAALSKDMSNVAESISMVISLQAKNFISNIHRIGSDYVFPYKTEDSFREYKFQTGCQYPDCPSDFGDLTGRTRMAGWNGSTDHSSVYLYQSTFGTGASLRDDVSWEDLVANTYYVQPVIDALAYQDDSFVELYRHYDTTVLFYLSVQVCTDYSADCYNGYTSIHRGYPGTERNMTTYDPPHRGWFRHAPEDAFYLEGPYKETFTGLYVVTLTSRKTLSNGDFNYLQFPGSGRVVTGAVVTLDSLADLIRDAAYPNEGFGVVIKYDTQQVLVWHNASTGKCLHALFSSLLKYMYPACFLTLILIFFLKSQTFTTMQTLVFTRSVSLIPPLEITI